MKTIVLFLSLSAVSAFAHSGVLKGAASDLHFAAKKAVFPVRHFNKTRHGLAKGAKAVAKTAAQF